jgi:hypothetical protein
MSVSAKFFRLTEKEPWGLFPSKKASFPPMVVVEVSWGKGRY